jgi:hypothetical protein
VNGHRPAKNPKKANWERFSSSSINLNNQLLVDVETCKWFDSYLLSLLKKQQKPKYKI